jgi:hypothetical protein
MTNAKPKWIWKRLANLRSRVHRALDVSEAAAQLARTTDPEAGAALESAIRELVTIMQVELSVETTELVPLIADGAGNGPLRAERLRAELVAEGEALKALRQDPEESKSLTAIADGVLDAVTRIRWSLRREDEILAPARHAHSFELERP